MRRWSDNKLLPLAVLAVAVAADLVGLPFVLVGTCLVLGMVLLPTVPVLSSVVGRAFLSVMVFAAVLQLAVTVRSVTWPDSGFGYPAVLTSCAYAALVVARMPGRGRGRGRGRPRRWVTRDDVPGLVIVTMFLVPFLPILVGDDSVSRIARIAGGQAIDGINHFSYVAEIVARGHWDPGLLGNYPVGFHSVVAFTQDALLVDQGELSWRNAVLLYMAQYLVAGAVASTAVGYLLSAMLRARAASEQGGRWLAVAAAVGCAGALVPLVLLPFVQQGFLNYLYVLATVVVAFAVLLDVHRSRPVVSVLLYLLLVFGASASWPLLVPPLVLTAVLLLAAIGPKRVVSLVPPPVLLLLAALAVAQLVPVLQQLRQSGAGDGLSATGSLRTFQPSVLLVSAALIVLLVTGNRWRRGTDDVVSAALLPVTAFVGVLAMYQYFTLGEVRYYVIKAAFLAEVTNVVVLTALVVDVARRLPMPHRLGIAAVVPPVVSISLVALVANPVEDVRNLFRDPAGQVKPQFFDADIAALVALGDEGRVQDYNVTALHRDPTTGRFAAHMQPVYWAGTMQYDGETEELPEKRCNLALYENLSFTAASDQQQADLVREVDRCAGLAAGLGQEYLIVTDPESSSAVRERFGSVATVVVEGS